MQYVPQGKGGSPTAESADQLEAVWCEDLGERHGVLFDRGEPTES